MPQQKKKKDKAFIPAKKENKQNIMEMTATRVEERMELHMGPIPSPQALMGYEAVCPGAADRIISMAEEQSNHRQYIEKEYVKARSRDSLLGIIAGFIIAMTGLVSGVVLIWVGKTGFGGILSIGSLVSLAGLFIYGTRSNKKERLEKDKQLKNPE